jgi:uncharacterized protein YjbI with pentapeptide repeats
MRDLEQSEHTCDGEPIGDFAKFVNGCRDTRQESVGVASFKHINYLNDSVDRRLPLFNCSLRDSSIRGMFLVQDFRRATFTNVDFAHGAGLAIWVDSSFKACNLRSFRAQISATRCTFHRCHFGSCTIENSVFIECRFEKCTMAGVWTANSFAECHFVDADLAGSVWREPGMMRIHGTWKNAETATGFVVQSVGGV